MSRYKSREYKRFGDMTVQELMEYGRQEGALREKAETWRLEQADVTRGEYEKLLARVELIEKAR